MTTRAIKTRLDDRSEFPAYVNCLPGSDAAQIRHGSSGPAGHGEGFPQSLTTESTASVTLSETMSAAPSIGSALMMPRSLSFGIT